MTFLFDLMFRPDRLEDSAATDDILVTDIANELDATPEYVIEVASREAGVQFDMDEFFRTGTLPPMIRHWLKRNNPCPQTERSLKSALKENYEKSLKTASVLSSSLRRIL